MTSEVSSCPYVRLEISRVDPSPPVEPTLNELIWRHHIPQELTKDAAVRRILFSRIFKQVSQANPDAPIPNLSTLEQRISLQWVRHRLQNSAEPLDQELIFEDGVEYTQRCHIPLFMEKIFEGRTDLFLKQDLQRQHDLHFNAETLFFCAARISRIPFDLAWEKRDIFLHWIQNTTIEDSSAFRKKGGLFFDKMRLALRMKQAIGPFLSLPSNQKEHQSQRGMAKFQRFQRGSLSPSTDGQTEPSDQKKHQ